MNQIANKKPGNGRTATRKARRQQLINATIDSISRRGFSGTTLATVTKSAKLSHGTVNFHFENKEDLYGQTLGYLAREHYDHWSTAMAAAGPDPARQLAAIIEVDFKSTICSTKKLAVWFAFWGQAKYRPTYLKIHNNYDNQRWAELKRLCTELARDGGYAHIEPTETTRNIEAMIDGLWLQLLLHPKKHKRSKARDNCFNYLAQLFPKHFSRCD
ncbi:MAG: TetR family transcriptional regulator C-terminal domain-containing protein [Rhodospirillaceae bacterium]|nr:TetR family transcriptional regulator C-terminal domain-containing protein [Rhodospirillaceae bacterium]MBL6930054.1 TetR family transcriptional regulator C-terminal domain-containing protein [Rhodospirillales bacterium]MBL6942497.1 TetR family transcriptional regulator C-terminal domain-containing protein [Rhodospirillales bacterium]